MSLASLSGVTVAFGERRLLDAVNLTIATGSRTALVGPNGSGKTTLMRIMAGQSLPDTGVVVAEKDTRVSYVPQSGVVPAGCTLRELQRDLARQGVTLVFAHVVSQVRGNLDRLQLTQALGPQHIFHTLREAMPWIRSQSHSLPPGPAAAGQEGVTITPADKTG